MIRTDNTTETIDSLREEALKLALRGVAETIGELLADVEEGDSISVDADADAVRALTTVAATLANLRYREWRDDNLAAYGAAAADDDEPYQSSDFQ